MLRSDGREHLGMIAMKMPARLAVGRYRHVLLVDAGTTLRKSLSAKLLVLLHRTTQDVLKKQSSRDEGI